MIHYFIDQYYLCEEGGMDFTIIFFYNFVNYYQDILGSKLDFQFAYIISKGGEEYDKQE